MDGEVHEAFRGIRGEVAAVRGDVLSLRRDFDVHVKDDLAMRSQLDQWTGALRFTTWVLGIGIPAIFAVLIALFLRH